MLHPKLLVVALVLCTVWLLMIFDLVRRQKLTEGLSFVWVLSSIFLTLAVVFSGHFTQIGRWFGIQYPENTVLVLGLGTLAIASLYFSTRISDLTKKIVRLSEEIAILKGRGKSGDSSKR